MDTDTDMDMDTDMHTTTRTSDVVQPQPRVAQASKHLDMLDSEECCSQLLLH